MRFILLIAFCAVGLMCCSDEGNPTTPPQITWNKLGLDGKTVNQMALSGGELYVATTTGLFKIQIDNSEDDFVLQGFENKNVQALQVISDHELLVSIVDKTGAEKPALFRSVNSGETWTPLDTDFGGDHPEPLLDFELHPNDDGILFGTGLSVIAKSLDQGESWEPVYGDWGGFASGISVVAINPKKTNEVWAGGQGAIENGFLLKTTNEDQWEEWSNLVDNPSVVKEITFVESNERHVFVGFEGALLRTTNGGAAWQTLIDSDEHKFFFGIGVRKGDADRVYTAGWIKTSDPQPLVLHISNTAGDTWMDDTHPTESYGGVWELLLKSEPGKDRLFLGLDKGGVYEVTVVN